jgi:hypothetical protein
VKSRRTDTQRACVPGWRARLMLFVEPVLVLLFVIAAIGGFIAVYFLLFQTDSCPSKSFACVVNNNKGLLTLYAIVIAVVGVTATAIVRLLDHRNVRSRFNYLLQRAVYEACHNLRHISESFEEQHLVSSPEYTLRTVRELAREPLDLYLRKNDEGRQLWAHIDHMIRNDDILRRLKWGGQLSLAEDPTKYLVEHMLRFLLDATRLFPREAECVLKAARGRGRGTHPLHSVLEAVQQTREREPELKPFVRFARSKVRDRIAEQEPQPHVAWCWYNDDDEPVECTEVKAVGLDFAALMDPP